MRYEPETTFDQRALDRTTRRAKQHTPAAEPRKDIDRTTMRHYHEEVKFVARRVKR